MSEQMLVFAHPLIWPSQLQHRKKKLKSLQLSNVIVVTSQSTKLWSQQYYCCYIKPYSEIGCVKIANSKHFVFVISSICTRCFVLWHTSTLLEYAIGTSNHRIYYLTQKQLYWNFVILAGERIVTVECFCGFIVPYCNDLLIFLV